MSTKCELSANGMQTPRWIYKARLETAVVSSSCIKILSLLSTGTCSYNQFFESGFTARICIMKVCGF